MVTLTPEEFRESFGKQWSRDIDVSMRNLADITRRNISALAPWQLNPPPGHRHLALTQMVSREGEARYDVGTDNQHDYWYERNLSNHRNPQTVHYVDRAVDNALHGNTKQWWNPLENGR